MCISSHFCRQWPSAISGPAGRILPATKIPKHVRPTMLTWPPSLTCPLCRAGKPDLLLCRGTAAALLLSMVAVAAIFCGCSSEPAKPANDPQSAAAAPPKPSSAAREGTADAGPRRRMRHRPTGSPAQPLCRSNRRGRRTPVPNRSTCWPWLIRSNTRSPEGGRYNRPAWHWSTRQCRDDPVSGNPGGQLRVRSRVHATRRRRRNPLDVPRGAVLCVRRGQRPSRPFQRVGPDQRPNQRIPVQPHQPAQFPFQQRPLQAGGAGRAFRGQPDQDPPNPRRQRTVPLARRRGGIRPHALLADVHPGHAGAGRRCGPGGLSCGTSSACSTARRRSCKGWIWRPPARAGGGRFGQYAGAARRGLGRRRRTPARGLSSLVAQVNPCVVTIKMQQSQGSGFVVHANGMIATNYHVIEGAKEAIVVFPNKSTFAVRGFLAILAQEGHGPAHTSEPTGNGFRSCSFANTPLAKGERVFAFGAPLGMSGSVSEGIVAALPQRRRGPQHPPRGRRPGRLHRGLWAMTPGPNGFKPRPPFRRATAAARW